MLKKIKLDDIKISRSFLRTQPSESKIQAVEKYYKRHRKVDKNIIIDDNNVLVDGYIRYLVLKAHGQRYTRQYKYGIQTYVYGKHSGNDKEFVWKLKSNTKNKDNLVVGCKAIVATRYGLKEIVVTRIEKLINPPVQTTLKKVVRVL